MPRPTDLLDDLPDLPSFTAGRACDKERVLEEARWDALHSVRSGMRDIIDWLTDAGVVV